MRGTAAEHTDLIIDDNSNFMWKTIKDCYNWCEVKSGDLDTISTAKRFIQKTKIRNREFSVYISEVCAKQKKSNFNNKIMKFFIRQNINNKLK